MQQLPIRSLKIDRSFVSTLLTTPRLHQSNTVIIEAICAMAHKLDKSIIAEGVETEGQRAYLTQLGYDYAQGFLFAKPLLAREAERLLPRKTVGLNQRSAGSRWDSRGPASQ